MAQIYPFAAIRPKAGLESRIAALPYDVYSREEAKAEVLREPMSFLKIDRAETQFDQPIDLYDKRVYEKAHDTLWQMVRDGDFIKDDKDCYYLYELVMNGRSQTGIVAKASVDDYLNGVIKKHENTRQEKELDRIRHVDVCDAQTGPIFLAYRSRPSISAIVDKVRAGKPLCSFTSPDGVMHRVWKIDGDEEINALKEQFASIGEIYIADGHHRCASAVKVSQKRRSENPSYTGHEEYNYFLSVLFPDDQLFIMDYNRVLRDLNGHSPETLKEALAESFDIERIDSSSYASLDESHRQEALHPKQKGEMTMYLDGDWYRLTAKESIRSADPVNGLDVALLQNYVLEPLFGITDPKTDERIDFVGGIRGLAELERRVSDDCAVAFAMYPTSIGELFAVADSGQLMPPKSTWFEPKLRSGLFIHGLT